MFQIFQPAAFERISERVIAGLINISPAPLPSLGKVSNFRCRLMLQVGGLLLRNLLQFFVSEKLISHFF